MPVIGDDRPTAIIVKKRWALIKRSTQLVGVIKHLSSKTAARQRMTAVERCKLVTWGNLAHAERREQERKDTKLMRQIAQLKAHNRREEEERQKRKKALDAEESRPTVGNGHNDSYFVIRRPQNIDRNARPSVHFFEP